MALPTALQGERLPRQAPPSFPLSAPPSRAVVAPDGGPLLQLDGVSVDYRLPDRHVRAVHRLSLAVRAGERRVLLGASGCGKSTLLKAIGGFTPASEGEIRLNGNAITRPGPDRAMVFQEFDQLPPWKTVHENVAFPLLASRRCGRREAAARARLYVEKVGLSRFADAYPHQLSGGMKQRAAIARALAMQPDVLLMDEPFAALDALTRRRMQEELLALWDEFRFTLVFVTHAIDEALIVGSRVAVLSPHPGRLRAEIDASRFGFADIGSGDFNDAAARLNGLLSEAPR